MANSYTTSAIIIEKMGTRIYNVLNVADASDISANTKLLQAIDEANATVDGYLESTYELPLDSVPGDIEGACTDIAIYSLIKNYRRDLLTEGDVAIKDDAHKLLRDYQKGVRSLPDSVGTIEDPSVSPTSHVIGSSVSDSTRATAISPTWFGNW